MSKRLCTLFAAILFAGALNFLAAANDKPQTFKGVVTLMCAAPPANANASPSASPLSAAAGDTCRFTLATPDKKLFVLDPQERVSKFSKKTVTVTGTVSTAAKTKMATVNGVVEASTIQVASITPASGS